MLWLTDTLCESSTHSPDFTELIITLLLKLTDFESKMMTEYVSESMNTDFSTRTVESML